MKTVSANPQAAREARRLRPRAVFYRRLQASLRKYVRCCADPARFSLEWKTKNFGFSTSPLWTPLGSMTLSGIVEDSLDPDSHLDFTNVVMFYVREDDQRDVVRKPGVPDGGTQGHIWHALTPQKDRLYPTILDDECWCQDRLRARVRGIEGGAFADFDFFFEVWIPKSYPMKPPVIFALQPIFHPRCIVVGSSPPSVCFTRNYEVNFPQEMRRLNLSGTLLGRDLWWPGVWLLHALLVLRRLLFAPVTELRDAWMANRPPLDGGEAGRLLVEDPEEFEARAVKSCEQYAMPVSRRFEVDEDEWIRIEYFVSIAGCRISILAGKHCCLCSPVFMLRLLEQA